MLSLRVNVDQRSIPKLGIRPPFCLPLESRVRSLYEFSSDFQSLSLSFFVFFLLIIHR